MKRFHIHLHVEDLAANIGFYSRLFAAEPTRLESDYAKWMTARSMQAFFASVHPPAGAVTCRTILPCRVMQKRGFSPWVCLNVS